MQNAYTYRQNDKQTSQFLRLGQKCEARMEESIFPKEIMLKM